MPTIQKFEDLICRQKSNPNSEKSELKNKSYQSYKSYSIL
jgi:hypothetical protein